MRRIAVIALITMVLPALRAQDYVDSLRVRGENLHVQGISYDSREKCFYCSFTTVFYKIDTEGNILGSIDDIRGHLGAMAFDPHTRKVYASLECKDDEIGRGISAVMGTDAYKKDESRFYLAEIDVDSMTMSTHELPEVRADYLAGNYGCSGIDGVTIAPAFGTGKGRYVYVAYGVYGDTSRKDNDYNILLCYRPGHFRKPVKKYFIHTGNTTYGIQNLAFDPCSDKMFLCVYRGRKESWPNYGTFALRMDQKPVRARLEAVPYHREKVWQLTEFEGWRPSLGSTGICSLGDGFFYLGESGREKDRQYCDFKLYKLSESGDAPLKRP